MVEMIMGVLKKEQEESMVESQEEEGAEKVGSHEDIKARKVKKRKRVVHDPQRKRACVDCTKRCVRVHDRASSSDKSRPVATTLPSFFKIMMGYFSENMDIPPPFAKTILNLTGSNIYLEDAFGLRWRVHLFTHDGFLSFGHGWKNFVLDHAIGVGEFLVFRQIARSVFTVQIFAPSACERLYLCESNKRQSRKRKPREITSSTGNQTVKRIKNNGDKRIKKKKRTYNLQNYPGKSDCDVSVRVHVDSETPRAASDLKCCELSEQTPYIGAAKSHEVDEVFTTDQDKAQYVLDGETETTDDCTTRREKEAECNAAVGEQHIYDSTEAKTLESMAVIDASSNTKYMTVDADIETENCGRSSVPTNAELRTPLAMMDLNGEITDDIFLSADVYEFESDFCNPEAFSVEHMERLTNHSSEIDTEVPSGECAVDTCMKDKYNFLFPPDGNTVEQVEGLVPKDSSVKKDKLQDRIGTGQIAAEILPDSPKHCEIPELRQKLVEPGIGLKSGSLKEVNNMKFCVAVPPPDQTWLELPCRLPVLPRRKKQGRKIMVLKDPCARVWPVLYQCTPSFSGFITGWVDVRGENSLREGDACEFQLCAGNSELSFRVRTPGFQ